MFGIGRHDLTLLGAEVEERAVADVIFENGHTTTTPQVEASLLVVVGGLLPFAGSAGTVAFAREHL
jgi:hypothetical protein